MNRYIRLLQDEPVLRRLSLIQLIAYFAAWFSNVAIYTLLIQLGASPGLIALTAALHFLPGVLQAPFSGPVIDRIAPKRLMLALMVTEITATLPLMLVSEYSELWLLFVLVFLRMGASSFYFTLEMALLPRILRREKLKAANEIHSVIWSFSYTAGMAISGFIVYLVGVKIAFLLDALLFLFALMLLWTLTLPQRVGANEENFFKMMRQSFGYMKEHAHIKHLMLLHAFVGFTTFDALVAMMVERYYAPAVSVALAIGLLHAFRALGLVIGPVFLGKWMNNSRLVALFFFQGVSLLLWAAEMENFYASLAASVVVGLGTTTLWSYTYTLLQHHTDEAFYGRIVAYNDMLFLLTVALVSLIIGALAEYGLDLPSITMLLGGAFFAGMFYFAWIRSRFAIKEITV
jgi:DHA3 family macrolide efflux protein-like MFS transporter